MDINQPTGVSFLLRHLFRNPLLSLYGYHHQSGKQEALGPDEEILEDVEHL